jgi:hypothetical protein
MRNGYYSHKHCNDLYGSHADLPGKWTIPGSSLQYSENRGKNKDMDMTHWLEEFKQLTPFTQIALILFAMAMVVLLIAFPTSGTSIITFLAALKMLAGPIRAAKD